MAHPIQVIYLNTLKGTIKTLLGGFHDAYSLFAPNPTEEEAKRLFNDIESVVENSYQKIIEAATGHIVRYLNYYAVEPRGNVDEFKAIYFVGRAISDFLEREGLSDCMKINWFAVVWALDFRHYAHTGHYRPNLTLRLHKLIREAKVNEHLGSNGMYLIYKCASNSVLDFKKTAKNAT
jgi:hypothetical protein